MRRRRSFPIPDVSSPTSRGIRSSALRARDPPPPNPSPISDVATCPQQGPRHDPSSHHPPRLFPAMTATAPVASGRQQRPATTSARQPADTPRGRTHHALPAWTPPPRGDHPRHRRGTRQASPIAAPSNQHDRSHRRRSAPDGRKSERRDPCGSVEGPRAPPPPSSFPRAGCARRLLPIRALTVVVRPIASAPPRPVPAPPSDEGHASAGAQSAPTALLHPA